MIWMKLRKSPAKEDGVYRMKDADRTSLPLLALQELYAPTVFYAFIFLAVGEKSNPTNTAYVYMWICLLSECFVSLWSIPHFTLCTSLNKVYKFIAVYRGAAKATVLLNTHGVKKHVLVLAVELALYKPLCKIH